MMTERKNDPSGINNIPRDATQRESFGCIFLCLVNRFRERQYKNSFSSSKLSTPVSGEEGRGKEGRGQERRGENESFKIEGEATKAPEVLTSNNRLRQRKAS